MKCRFWTTIFKLLLPFAASALTIDADIDIRTEINQSPATSTVCKIKLNAVPDGNAWMIKNISGTWNEHQITSDQPFRFTTGQTTVAPVDEVLNYLLPFASEIISAPTTDGIHKLDNALIKKLMEPYGFAVEGMKISGEWLVKTPRTTLSIIGQGGEQQINYRMILDGTKRETKFNFKIKAGVQDGGPFADGTIVERSGTGVVKITK